MNDDTISNPGGNPDFEKVHLTETSRRAFLQVGAGAVALRFFAPQASAAATEKAATPFSFTDVPISTDDQVHIPPGYEYQVIYPWGQPLFQKGPEFKPNATNTAAEQEQQAGMGHDGMQWFEYPETLPPGSPARGLLALNHEYTDQGLLFKDGIKTMNAEKVKKSQAAHGVSVIAIEQQAGGGWQVVDSKWNRRITANTKMQLTGPAAGSTLMQTHADPEGKTVFGTMNNCASGKTPWGTYLTCEENFNGVFGSRDYGLKLNSHQERYGFSLTGFSNVYQWWVHDDRFDLEKEPQESNRFGYVVEIDPRDPQSIPRKHTALGRFKHENAAVTLSPQGHVVVYMGDDEKNEYLYKFVSAKKYDPHQPAANFDLLTDGTLYVARFDKDNKGSWLAFVHEKNGLTEANGFPDQASICVKTRQAADRAGATMMDRPEWVAIDPKTKSVYVTLTNNNLRGKKPESVNPPDGSAKAGKSQPPIDAANPRAANIFGHIIQWNEAGGDAAAESFTWDIFLLAGDPERDKELKFQGDAFGSPDGLTFDPRGFLWIQTDISTSTLHRGAYKEFGNNMMLAADPATKTVRRFLTGPRGAEITGLVLTPDLKTMFVNIQHPGEPDSDLSDHEDPKKISDWPDGPAGGRPRPATIAIRRKDGGLIGS